MTASHEQRETYDQKGIEKGPQQRGARRPMQTVHYDDVEAGDVQVTGTGSGQWQLPLRTESNDWLSSDRAYVGEDENDDTLAGNIIRRVMLTDYIDVSRVHIAVSHATVTLTGTVRSETNRSEIEQLIAGCVGVHIIDNRLCIESVNRS